MIENGNTKGHGQTVGGNGDDAPPPTIQRHSDDGFNTRNATASMSQKTLTFANRISELFYDVNQPQLAMHMHRPDVLHQYSLDALETMMSVKETMKALQQLSDLKRDDPMAYNRLILETPHDCDMCNTRHIDGDLCDPTTCEHDYDSDKADDGWMVCIYCHDEQPDDYDGDDY